MARRRLGRPRLGARLRSLPCTERARGRVPPRARLRPGALALAPPTPARLACIVPRISARWRTPRAGRAGTQPARDREARSGGMTEATIRPGQFQPGKSGNAGGRPRTSDISAIARRFTPDALSGLVRTVRLDPRQHGSNVVQAARELLRWGFGEPPKTVNLTVNGDGLAAHLLAVQAAFETPALEPPEIDGEAEPGFDDADLPEHNALPVEEALLPLFEATRQAPPRQVGSIQSPDATSPGQARPPDGASGDRTWSSSPP